MEFSGYREAHNYVDSLGVENMLEIGTIIRESRWPGADIAESDYYIIKKITKCFVMVEELGMMKKISNTGYGGYHSTSFRLYQKRADIPTPDYKKKKSKFAIKSLSSHNIVAEKKINRFETKYGLWSLNDTYNGQIDYGR